MLLAVARLEYVVSLRAYVAKDVEWIREHAHTDEHAACAIIGISVYWICAFAPFLAYHVDTSIPSLWRSALFETDCTE